MTSPAMIDRQFLRITDGLVHLRRLDGTETGTAPSLWLLHASPASSRLLEGLMLALRQHGLAQTIVAPDTLGNGDSAPPAADQPDIGYFADSLARLLDAAGTDRIDVYGTHTGARIATEFAVRHPSRTRRVVLDGIASYSDDLKREILAHYAPAVAPDEYGRQFVWAFNFVRDQWLHFPYFMRDPDHRLTRAMPSPDILHLGALDVLKALGSYHKPYLAAFRYEAAERLPLVAAATLFLRSKTELANLNAAIDHLAGSMQKARVVGIDGTDDDRARAMTAFLVGER